MPDRHDVHPHHLLRAVLGDQVVRDLLRELGTDADDVSLTLDRRWLDAADTIDVEEVETLGVGLPMVLAALNPPYDGPPDWGGRHLLDSTREVLVRALGMRGPTSTAPVRAAHVLLALMTCKDSIVGGAFRDHGVTLKAARPVVDRWTRRTP
ncbi:Clp protease N-terminal domain-containing protein [Nocardioides litoris]|uniref:Clp protease N-terminal domain-containing protein n=1 Tax=Nocardioides litoris TaxID=1926648 RepID=UPI001121042A|nr:Clp protease N-terminal domain-containing protein [Nocardioides litoris]